ncbi:hypothetical protein BG004_005687 [Podila humilis]|nr:hypothetical protein BG004_005687 [Podila humilis]
MASQLHVLIVGAGISGLLFAGILERANISYEIFEKTKEQRQGFGSNMSISIAMVAVFEQLGLYEHFISITRPFGAMHLKDQDLKPLGSFLSVEVSERLEKRYGEQGRCVARPDLVKMLMSLVPEHKIHYGKRVLATKQDEDHVTITCSDNQAYRGSILVGADGAYSSVRQNMYKELAKVGRLPKSDSQPLGYGFDCAVGVAHNLDPEQYETLKTRHSQYQIVLGKDIPYTWWFMPLTNNRIGWMITQDIRTEGEDGQRNFRFSEWGPDAAVEMCNKVRDFESPFVKGGTVGDILDKTPPGGISKVMLEDKFFETWYSGRTVLIGDACHKMLPFGGEGANMGMSDGVELANLLFDLHSDSYQDITTAFETYYRSRRGPCKSAVNVSHQNGSLTHNKGFLASLLRYVVLNFIPNWVFFTGSDKYNALIHQINFLPYVKFKGVFQPKSNPPSWRLKGSANNSSNRAQAI